MLIGLFNQFEDDQSADMKIMMKAHSWTKSLRLVEMFAATKKGVTNSYRM